MWNQTYENMNIYIAMTHCCVFGTFSSLSYDTSSLQIVTRLVRRQPLQLVRRKVGPAERDRRIAWPVVQQVRGSIPGGVINFHLKFFNLGARRGGDVHFLIARLYLTGLD